MFAWCFQLWQLRVVSGYRRNMGYLRVGCRAGVFADLVTLPYYVTVLWIYTRLFFLPFRLLSSPFFSLSLQSWRRSGVIHQSFSPPSYGWCLALISREDFSSFSLFDSCRNALQQDETCSKQPFVHSKFYIPDESGKVCNLEFYMAQVWIRRWR